MNKNTTPTTKLFVYGTLMKGQHAHDLLEDCPGCGTYILRDYAMYNLGFFPGISKKEGKCVIGEVYTIPKTLLPQLDQYEGEGSLYRRRTVTVTRGEDQMEVQTYVYAHEADPETVMDKPWNHAEKDLIWHATYGSNLDYGRFLCYIKGTVCRWNGRQYKEADDPTPPRAHCFRDYPGRLYFANSSGSWGGSSVAFFDPTPSSPSDQVHMHLYKISWEQFRHIHEQEGNSPNWYPRAYCLGVAEDGVPVYTLTSERPKTPGRRPSSSYTECMIAGLTDGGFSRSEAEEYLEQWM